MKDDQGLVESLLAHDDDVAVPADHDRRIREGLGALLGAAPGAGDAPDAPSPAAPSPRASELAGSAARKWLTTTIVAIAAAGGGFAIGRATAPEAVTTSPHVAPASASTGVAPAPVSDAVASASAASASASAPLLAPAPSASIGASVHAAPSPDPAGDAFDREQSLLERARSALVRHDADAAEAALAEHDRQFPR
ncbi:MAG: hypothetical protein KF894_22705, partial [Labilithrix sp.]|nr:hypothetical protein [Labilithrix sp.]